MYKQQITSRISELIGKAHLNRAFQAALLYVDAAKERDLREELVLLQSRYARNERQFNGGLISRQDYDLESNKINAAFLDLLERLPEEAPLAEADLQPILNPVSTKNQIQGANRGHILYGIPRRMELQKRHRCVVRIAPLDLPKAILKGDLLLEEAPVLETLRISQVMTVRLEELPGEDEFDIVALNTEEQIIEPGDFTEWQFLVTPLHPGRHSLVLKVSVTEMLEKFGERKKDAVVLDREIEVVTEPVEELAYKLEAAGPVAFSFGSFPVAPGKKVSWSPLPQDWDENDSKVSKRIGEGNKSSPEPDSKERKEGSEGSGSTIDRKVQTAPEGSGGAGCMGMVLFIGLLAVIGTFLF